MHTHRPAALLALVATTISVTLGQHPAATEAVTTAAPTATLTIAEPGDVVKLDPQSVSDIPSANVFLNIYDTLVTQNAQGDLVPDLATSWRQVNGTTWIFTLRHGVRFSNGDPFNATVVKGSFARLLSPATASPRASLFKAVSRITALGSDRVEFTLTRPFAPLLANLSNYAGAIIDPAVATAEGAAFSRQPVGTGPFKLLSWQPDNKLTLVRNTRYWGPAPQVARVVYQVVPDPSTRLSLLESNQVQVVQGVPPAQMSSLGHIPGIALATIPGFGLEYIGFNDQTGPFRNVAVRQALTYATDRASIIHNIYRDTAALARGPMPPTVFGAATHLPQYSYNPALARQLLKKAGYPNGFSTTMYVPTINATWLQVAQTLQSEWAAVGVKLSIQNLEWATFLQYIDQGKTPVFIVGWSNMTGDGDYNQYYLFDSHTIKKGSNDDFYSNLQVDRLVEAARVATDPATRRADYLQAQQIEVAQAAAIFLAFDQNTIAERQNVHGILQARNSVLYLRSASMTS